MPDMSFLPEDYVEKRAQRRTNVISLTLFVVVMGAVVAAFFVTDQQRTEVRRQQSQVNSQFEEAAKRLENLDKLQEQKKQMMRKAQLTSKLVERVPRSLVLAELINNMPATLSLIEFKMETKVAQNTARRPKTSLAAAKKKMQDKLKAEAQEPQLPATDVFVDLTGVASTDVQVAKFMTALDRSSMFEELNLLFSEETKVEDQKMRKFRIEMKLNQSVDLKQYQPLMVQRELNHNPMDKKVGFDKSGQIIKAVGPVGADNPVVPAVDVDPQSLKD